MATEKTSNKPSGKKSNMTIIAIGIIILVVIVIGAVYLLTAQPQKVSGYPHQNATVHNSTTPSSGRVNTTNSTNSTYTAPNITNAQSSASQYSNSSANSESEPGLSQQNVPGPP
jgi:flagellar basal body-associated protein FliL